MINVVWLTVNRLCNFRCPWCYAENTKYLKANDMAYDLCTCLIDFAKTLGVKKIILIGGEPTYYPHFFEVLKYIKNQDMQPILITNGYRFKDMDFVEKSVDAGLSSISFSIKAANAGQQKELTKVDAFEDIKQAIKNLSTVKDLNVGYSTVISKDTIENAEEFAQMLAAIDHTKHLTYTMCRPVFDENRKVCVSCVPTLKDVVDTFVKKFDRINEILNNRVLVDQSIALCAWPKEFIEKLKEKKQISFGCHLRSRNGLIFDKGGEVIPCHSLSAFPIGRFGSDFTNKEEFEKFWMSKKLVKLYDKIFEYPSAKCQSCDDYSECGGGCPIKWFAYSAKEVLGH